MTDPFTFDMSRFDGLLDTWPGPGAITLEYLLALALVSEGKAQLICVTPASTAEGRRPSKAIAIFKGADGQVFTVVSPGLDENDAATMMEMLQDMLDEDVHD